jgi:hypothetical protein
LEVVEVEEAVSAVEEVGVLEVRMIEKKFIVRRS